MVEPGSVADRGSVRWVREVFLYPVGEGRAIRKANCVTTSKEVYFSDETFGFHSGADDRSLGVRTGGSRGPRQLHCPTRAAVPLGEGLGDAGWVHSGDGPEA